MKYAKSFEKYINCFAGNLDKGRRGYVLLGDHGGQVQERCRLCTH